MGIDVLAPPPRWAKMANIVVERDGAPPQRQLHYGEVKRSYPDPKTDPSAQVNTSREGLERPQDVIQLGDA